MKDRNYTGLYISSDYYFLVRKTLNGLHYRHLHAAAKDGYTVEPGGLHDMRDAVDDFIDMIPLF